MNKEDRFYVRYSKADEAIKDVLPENLAKIPYPIIYKHAEDKLIHAGEEVFKYAALQILSPYAPKMMYAGDEHRISINIMVIGKPSSGKTQIIKLAQVFAPEGKEELVQKVTEHALQNMVNRASSGLEIFVNDMKTIMGDSGLLKAFESVIADGFIKRETANDKLDEEDARAALMGAAVPNEISSQIDTGLIFRIVPIEIKYTQEQQKDIINHISNKVGEQTSKVGTTNQDISDFYDILYHLINGKFDDYPRIKGYKISENLVSMVTKSMFQGIEEFNNFSENAVPTRQYWDGLRFLALHSLLNVHNREIVDKDGNQLTEEEIKNNEKDGYVVAEELDATVAQTLLLNQLDILNSFMSRGKIQADFEEMESFGKSGKFTTNQINKSYNS